MATQLAVIECGKSYRLPEFQKISGMGERAVRAAQKKGLKVIYVGRVGWIRGDDFHAFLAHEGEEQGSTDATQE